MKHGKLATGFKSTEFLLSIYLRVVRGGENAIQICGLQRNLCACLLFYPHDMPEGAVKTLGETK